MNLAVKAAIFNAILFPGWGHFYLKLYKRGIAIMLPVLASILSLCWSVFQIAVDVLRTAPIQNNAVNISYVLKLTSDSLKAINSLYFTLISLLIIVLWIFSIADGYLLGKKEMQNIIQPPISADPQ